jgi:hypothetical protein
MACGVGVGKERVRCAEGRSPFAEGLGVSPNSPISPHEWGTKGVDRAS